MGRRKRPGHHAWTLPGTQDKEGRGSPQTMGRNKLTAWALHSTVRLEPSHARIPDGGGWSGPQKGLFLSLGVLHCQTNTSKGGLALRQKVLNYLLLSGHLLGPMILGKDRRWQRLAADALQEGQAVNLDEAILLLR